jgi:hypothetical protein
MLLVIFRWARSGRVAGMGSGSVLPWWCAAWWEAFAESDDVGAGGGEDVLDVGLCHAVVAAVVQAMGVDGFGDGGFAAGVDGDSSGVAHRRATRATQAN